MWRHAILAPRVQGTADHRSIRTARTDPAGHLRQEVHHDCRGPRCALCARNPPHNAFSCSSACSFFAVVVEDDAVILFFNFLKITGEPCCGCRWMVHLPFLLLLEAAASSGSGKTSVVPQLILDASRAVLFKCVCAGVVSLCRRESAGKIKFFFFCNDNLENQRMSDGSGGENSFVSFFRFSNLFEFSFLPRGPFVCFNSNDVKRGPCESSTLERTKVGTSARQPAYKVAPYFQLRM